VQAQRFFASSHQAVLLVLVLVLVLKDVRACVDAALATGTEIAQTRG
jgi:hypothetical protein